MLSKEDAERATFLLKNNGRTIETKFIYLNGRVQYLEKKLAQLESESSRQTASAPTSTSTASPTISSSSSSPTSPLTTTTSSTLINKTPILTVPSTEQPSTTAAVRNQAPPTTNDTTTTPTITNKNSISSSINKSWWNLSNQTKWLQFFCYWPEQLHSWLKLWPISMEIAMIIVLLFISSPIPGFSNSTGNFALFQTCCFVDSLLLNI